MKKDKKVLLIIDPQKGFKNKNTQKCLNNINSIMDYFDVCFASLFFNPDKSLYSSLLYWNNFSKHKKSEYSELAINKNKKLRIIKTYKYGKITWKFWLFLKLHKIKTLYICGLETDACVYKTALDVFDLKIVPIVLEDCCGSCRGKSLNDIGIKLLKRQIGEDQVLSFGELKKKIEPKILEVF